MTASAELSLPKSGDASARVRWWMLALIALVAIVVYANSLRNDFAFDDVAVVQNNPRVLNLEWTRIWADNYWAERDGRQVDVLYRPLTIWTYLVNEALAPGAAWTFHLTNVALHAWVSVLVAVLAWRMLGNRHIAALTGMLFAVHPLHTEAVANTVGRAEILASLWFILALLVYLPAEGLNAEKAPQKKPLWHGLLVADCFFAALLSKETPATLAVAVVFIDAWRWARWEQEARPGFFRWFTGQTVRYYLPLTLALGGYLLMRLNACGKLMASVDTVHPIVNMLVTATPGERIVTPFLLLAKYLGLIFWPVHLSADYSAPSLLPTANPLSPGALTGILACMLLAIFSVRLWKKNPQLLLIGGLFFISYALVANVIRIGTIFGERLFYWPSAFVLMLVAWGLVSAYAGMRREITSGPARTALAAVASVLFVIPMGLMGYRTWVRNTDWADNVTLAIATGRDNPESTKACAWAGGILIITDREDFKDFGKVMLDRSVELSPYYPDVHWELAKYYGLRGDVANSVIELCIAAKFEPGTHMVRYGMTTCLTDFRMVPTSKYMPIFEEYEKTHPEESAIHLALALANHAQGKYDEAEAEALIALKMGMKVDEGGMHQYHEAAAELACIRADRGELEQAVLMFRKYVAAMPNCLDARIEMIQMLLALDHEKFPQAVAEAQMNLDRATKIDAADPQVRQLRPLVEKARAKLLAGAEDGGAVRTVSGVVP